MAKETILLLTNLSNEAPDEDEFLSNYLRNYFDVLVSHPLECEPLEDKADLILIRNIWPTFDYESRWKKAASRWIKKKLITYNPLNGLGDMRGKDYLVELYKKGFPVIPSINELKNLKNLPQTEEFFIKPKNRGDAVGTERISEDKLLKKKLKDYIIQPYVEFSEEVSFHFIDGKLAYAFTTKRKVGDYVPKEYAPTNEEIRFAKKFVCWNTLSYGEQRIDACRTKDGNLLLVEVEDWAPYLDLLNISKKTREKMLKMLIGSIKDKLSKYSH